MLAELAYEELASNFCPAELPWRGALEAEPSEGGLLAGWEEEEKAVCPAGAQPPAAEGCGELFSEFRISPVGANRGGPGSAMQRRAAAAGHSPGSFLQGGGSPQLDWLLRGGKPAASTVDAATPCGDLDGLLEWGGFDRSGDLLQQVPAGEEDPLAAPVPSTWGLQAWQGSGAKPGGSFGGSGGGEKA